MGTAQPPVDRFAVTLWRYRETDLRRHVIRLHQIRRWAGQDWANRIAGTADWRDSVRPRRWARRRSDSPGQRVHVRCGVRLPNRKR